MAESHLHSILASGEQQRVRPTFWYTVSLAKAARHNESMSADRRFRLGSAAIFWAALAVCIWLFFFFALARERSEVRWFFAWHLSKPALIAAALALLFYNLWRVCGGTGREPGFAAWLISVLAFPILAYLSILPIGLAAIGAVR
jgi:hypothetical protein